MTQLQSGYGIAHAPFVMGSELGELEKEVCSILLTEMSLHDMQVDDLSLLLERKGVNASYARVLAVNSVDGETFINFTRADLQDLFPKDFIARKTLWDISSKLKSGTPKDDTCMFDNFSEESFGRKSSSSGTSTPLSSVSTTLSLDSCSSEEDVMASQSQPLSHSMPPLKRTKPRELFSPLPSKKQKHSYLGEDFKLPTSREIQNSVEENQPLDDRARRQLIRESVTCVQAFCGKEISGDCLTELSKKMCKEIPVLRDEKPPFWPKDVEFQYWASTEHLLKKRVSNLKSSDKQSQKTASKSEEILNIGMITSQEDANKHEKELQKEISKRAVNWKAVEELQTLTFPKRCERISQITGRKAIETMLEEFPYLDHQKVILHELELHISQLTKSVATKETFISHWHHLRKCFLDDDQTSTDDSRTLLVPLKCLHEAFGGAQPVILTLPAGEKMDTYVKDVLPVTGPVLLVYAEEEGGTTNSQAAEQDQIFMVLQKEVLCECTAVGEYTLYSTAVVLLLAVYYTFNLCYANTDKSMFLFLEEHILGKVPKRKTYKYKRIENTLLQKIR